MPLDLPPPPPPIVRPTSPVGTTFLPAHQGSSPCPHVDTAPVGTTFLPAHQVCDRIRWKDLLLGFKPARKPLPQPADKSRFPRPVPNRPIPSTRI